MALSPEDRALLQGIADKAEEGRVQTALALERCDSTMKRLDDHIAEDRRRFEEVAKAMAGQAGKDVERKVEKLSSRQSWFMGIGAGVVFILTFFKATIVNMFSSGQPPPTS